MASYPHRSVGRLELGMTRAELWATTDSDALAAMEQPGQSQLSGRDALVDGRRAHCMDQVEVLLEVLALEARVVAPEVVGAKSSGEVMAEASGCAGPSVRSRARLRARGALIGLTPFG